MIRINLLPQKRRTRQDAGQKHLIYMGFGLMVVVGGLTVLHMHTEGILEDIQRENQAIKADVNRLKAELGDYEKIRAQREELMRQQETIKSLEARRTGPVYLLRELAEIMTPGKGPTFDRVKYAEVLRRDPNAGFNAAWDTRRVWLKSFDERNRQLRIQGSAKSNEDVAEFLKRLQASVFFENVVLMGTAQTSTGKSSVKHMTFNLNTGVVY